MKKKIIAAALGVAAFGALLTGCTSDADVASENIAKSAEQFEVQRTIVMVSGMTGKTIGYAEGRCSFEYPSSNRVDLTCKYGPNQYRKHTWIKGNLDSVVVTQEQPIDASVYHTRVIIKPENLIPEFDLQVGKQ